MKVILKYSLFRRTAPTNEVRANGFLPEGSVIDVEEVVEGKSIDAISSWYKATDGFFYWGGGVMESEALEKPVKTSAKKFETVEAEAIIDISKISWAHTQLKITDIWSDSGVAGEKVKVVVLDKGFDSNHSDLKHIQSEIFFPGSGSIEHGTKMTGIIGARGNKILGIAPGCELLFAKVNFNIADTIVNALKWANNMGADFISMSFNCEKTTAIEEELKKCADKNISLIAAAGNAGELDIPIDEYPASSQFCHAIGCFGKDFKRLPVSNITNNLKLVAPSQAILTAMPGDIAAEVDGDTSLATAFTAGVAALLLSVVRKTGKKLNAKEIMDLMCRDADKRNNGNDNHNDHYGFGLIDPFKSYQSIK